MRFKTALLAASAAFVVSLGTARAQDAAMEGHDMEAMGFMDLPAACQGAATGEMPGMTDMTSEIEAMDGHQRAFMEAMMATQMSMMQGVMAEDPDIAFACGMIPHHQGASAWPRSSSRWAPTRR